MPGTARRIQNLQLLRTTDPQEVSLRLHRSNVILHPRRQIRARIVQKPQPAQRVLHQILHNPMRRKQLRRRRDLQRRRLLILLKPREHLVLPRGNIELVQPPDHLNIRTHLRRQRPHNPGNNRPVREQIIRNQQLREIPRALKHKRHRTCPMIAIRSQQKLERLPLTITGHHRTRQQTDHPVPDLLPHHTGINMPGLRIRQHLRLPRHNTTGRRHHTHTRITIHVHKPQRHQTVKPRIRHLLHHNITTRPRYHTLKTPHRLRKLHPLHRTRQQHPSQPSPNNTPQLNPNTRSKPTQQRQIHAYPLEVKVAGKRAAELECFGRIHAPVCSFGGLSQQS